ncbi:MAG: hypothetical protein IJ806_04000 [Ruminococcus sp.]|nr:hypothetical protein [Ruminococcus sp.]
MDISTEKVTEEDIRAYLGAYGIRASAEPAGGDTVFLQNSGYRLLPKTEFGGLDSLLRRIPGLGQNGPDYRLYFDKGMGVLDRAALPGGLIFPSGRSSELFRAGSCGPAAAKALKEVIDLVKNDYYLRAMNSRMAPAKKVLGDAARSETEAIVLELSETMAGAADSPALRRLFITKLEDVKDSARRSLLSLGTEISKVCEGYLSIRDRSPAVKAAAADKLLPLLPESRRGAYIYSFAFYWQTVLSACFAPAYLKGACAQLYKARSLHNKGADLLKALWSDLQELSEDIPAREWLGNFTSLSNLGVPVRAEDLVPPEDLEEGELDVGAENLKGRIVSRLDSLCAELADMKAVVDFEKALDQLDLIFYHSKAELLCTGGLTFIRTKGS